MYDLLRQPEMVQCSGSTAPAATDLSMLRVMQDVSREYPGVVIIDYTLPETMGNAAFY
jgi:hypothetical protein